MKSAPGRSPPSSSPARAQQQLRLQRIGVLEFVDQDDAEAPAEFAAHFRVVADEVARLDQQVEEVERAGLLLPLFVALEARRASPRATARRDRRRPYRGTLSRHRGARRVRQSPDRA